MVRRSKTGMPAASAVSPSVLVRLTPVPPPGAHIAFVPRPGEHVPPCVGLDSPLPWLHFTCRRPRTQTRACATAYDECKSVGDQLTFEIHLKRWCVRPQCMPIEEERIDTSSHAHIKTNNSLPVDDANDSPLSLACTGAVCRSQVAVQYEWRNGFLLVSAKTTQQALFHYVGRGSFVPHGWSRRLLHAFMLRWFRRAQGCTCLALVCSHRTLLFLAREQACSSVIVQSKWTRLERLFGLARDPRMVSKRPEASSLQE